MVIARIDPDSGDGISYAVSSNKIKRCVDDIIRDGRYYHPSLGIYATDLTPQKCLEKGLGTTNGVYVEFSSGGAANAGILAGDLIIAVNGFKVHDVGEFASAVCEHVRYRGGATIRVIRSNKELDFELLPGYRAENMEEVTSPVEPSPPGTPSDLPNI
ncbi:MAG: hypothetical protein A2Z74_05485 [Chloroflexi bacterium RBG_13_46_9]|nr:MAG: hypothetical protein A2Z74_05485 [Chloroflexi bacterium RBG_13_46_9]